MKMRAETITTPRQRGAEAVFARVRAVARRPRSRRERMLAAVRDQATPRTIAIAGVGLVAVAGLAYAGRRFMRARADRRDAGTG